MAITQDDFKKVWASTSPLTPYSFSDSQYKEGWNFIGSTPPSRQMWDFLQKNNDEKMQYLANNYLPLSGGSITGDVDITGDLSVSGAITGNVKGNVTGVATSATNDGNGNNIARTYLPLAGGTMTGSTQYVNNGKVFTIGTAGLGNVDLGWNWSNRDGARIGLRSTDHSSQPGAFSLFARDANNERFLTGKPDGTLTWNGQPIQTSSDKRLKTDFADVPADVLEAWSKVEWKQFKYIADKERKGDSCRFHTGLVAQDVKEVGEANNVDLLKYGILCHDVREAIDEEKDEDGNIIKEASEAVDLWTVRYEEALAMEVIYLRNEIKKLREEIKALRT